jgi:hypothetical protein
VAPVISQRDPRLRRVKVANLTRSQSENAAHSLGRLVWAANAVAVAKPKAAVEIRLARAR